MASGGRAAYCRVALDTSVARLDRPFDYLIPERFGDRVRIGSVVRVPVHGRRMRAFVLELLDEPAVTDPKPISALVASDPLFGADELALARWAAERYVVALGTVLRRFVPGRYAAAATDGPAATSPPARAPAWLPPGSFSLDGSHRTIVSAAGRQDDLAAYAAGTAAAAGRRALVLVPRVADAERVGASLPGAALIHGELRPSDRARGWARARDGKTSVVVGTRAALLAPLADLGIVLALDAHDDGYKDERAPRIHALVAARERATRAGATFIAVSPAPPLGPLGGTEVLEPSRRGSGPRAELARPRTGPVTPRLEEVVRWAVGRGGDALVWVARRGFALRLRCRDCGWFPRCPSCDAGLSFDRPTQAGTLRCRHCATEAPAPDRCASCGGAHLRGTGWGSDRVASAVEALDIGAPVVRVEAGGALASDAPAPAVVVGTRRTLDALGGRRPLAICVADLDQQLALPDHRAAEIAHALLWDLAGLLAEGGRFVVQTREPDHRAVQAFVRRSYRYFRDRELAERRSAGYPPFGELVHVELDAADVGVLREVADDAGAMLVGPLPRARERAAVLLRTGDLAALLGPLRRFTDEHPRTRVDVDPLDVL